MECSNGVIVDVEVNANANYGYDVRTEMVCEKGTIIMAPSRKNEIMISNNHTFPYGKDWRPRFADAYRNQNQAWINSIIDNSISQGSSAWDGMISTMVAESGVESFEQEKLIKIETMDKPDFYKSI